MRAKYLIGTLVIGWPCLVICDDGQVAGGKLQNTKKFVEKDELKEAIKKEDKRKDRSDAPPIDDDPEEAVEKEDKLKDRRKGRPEDPTIDVDPEDAVKRVKVEDVKSKDDLRKRYGLLVLRRLRVEELLPEERYASAKAMFEEWDEDKQAADWAKFSAGAAKAMKAHKITTDVTIATFRDGKKTTGATIKYKLAGTKRVYTADLPSTVKERLAIGLYNIWSVRGGDATSDKSAIYELWEKEEDLGLTEEE